MPDEITAACSSAASYTGQQVLVTGGLGFIGSNLAIALARAGARVTVLDAMLPQYGARRFNLDPIKERVTVEIADMRDAAALARVIGGQEFIFQLAGQVSHLRSMEDPSGDLEINCRTQLSLLESCRKYNRSARLVLASTRQVYGRPQWLPVGEDHPTAPVDINGVHKLAAEEYYRLYHRVHGLWTVALRLTNTYGPRMDLVTADKGVVGVFVRRALLGETLQLFGGGRQRRDFNYVDDVVDALLLAGHCDDAAGRVFNLGYPQAYSLRELVEILGEITGTPFENVPFPRERSAIEIGDYWGDFAKLAALTGWRPRTDLAAGLRHTIAFFRRYGGEYLDR